MAPKKRSAAQGGRTKKAQKKESPKPQEEVQLDTRALLSWLLSDEALSLAYPPIERGKGEVDWSDAEVQKGGKKAPPPPLQRSGEGKNAKDGGKGEEETPLLYPAPYPAFSPFLTLVSSYLLSKPISHKLGLRTISTALNAPFNLRTRSAWEEIGYEGRRRVMWEAKTQHKEKSAEQLGEVLSGLRELEGDEKGDEHEDELRKLKSEVDKAAKDTKGAESRAGAREAVQEHLTKIKGLGKGACEIFIRRIQHPWASLYPYADSRSLEYAHEIGLLKEGLPEKDYTAPEDMDGLILERSKDLLAVFREGGLGGAEGGDGEREKFVRLLDVLVGLGLQKQLVEARKRAAGGGAANGGGKDNVKEEQEAGTAVA